MAKSKKKKSKYKHNVHYAKDGESIWITQHFWDSCCDCGLRHHVTIDREIKKSGEKGSITIPNDVPLCFRFYRDDYTTEREREKLGITLKNRRR